MSRRSCGLRRWRASLLAALVAVPAVAQDAPKSILPPGFETAPPQRVAAPEPAAPAEETQAPAADIPAPPRAAPLAADPLLAPPPPLPSGGALGWLTPEAGGYGPATFAGSNGRFLLGLLRRMDAPIASRWGEIVLRRALLSVTPPPSRARFADWTAERAWLLVRLGEVDGAKALVDQVPVERFSPRLYEVAAQVHLAAGDIPALCPLGSTAVTLSPEPLWQLVNAMCAGLEGDDLTSSSIFDTMRSRGKVNTFDRQLAERIAGAANSNGRAANVEWENVSTLTVYRFGLAKAAGLAVPQALLDRSSPAVKAWTLRSASAPLDARVAAAPTAAALGVSSADEMVALYSAQATEIDPFALDAAPAGRLRAAFAAKGTSERIAAMRTLWARGTTERERYGYRILTARAAAQMRVNPDAADAADGLVASMLAGGLVKPALRWWPVVDKAGGNGWALLALADPGRTVLLSDKRFNDWQAGETRKLGEPRAVRRAQLMTAALQGLGKGEFGDRLDAAPNAFTRAIDAAAASGRKGEVAVLAAVGLQRDWRSVPPLHLQHILAAYRRVGLAPMAHMLAVEALTRG